MRYKVLGIRYKVVGYWILDLGKAPEQVRGEWAAALEVQGIRYKVLGTRHKVVGIWILDFGEALGTDLGWCEIPVFFQLPLES